MSKSENPELLTQFALLQQKVNDAKADADQFYKKGNKAAGVRLRSKMLEARRICQDVRNEVTEKKNA